jgi:hypothetical protein
MMIPSTRFTFSLSTFSDDHARRVEALPDFPEADNRQRPLPRASGGNNGHFGLPDHERGDDHLILGAAKQATGQGSKCAVFKTSGRCSPFRGRLPFDRQALDGIVRAASEGQGVRHVRRAAVA